MNSIILSYNSNSGKYSLIGDAHFLCDTFAYNITSELWINIKNDEALKLENCTKPTAKAITLLTKTIENFYAS